MSTDIATIGRDRPAEGMTDNELDTITQRMESGDDGTHDVTAPVLDNVNPLGLTAAQAEDVRAQADPVKPSPTDAQRVAFLSVITGTDPSGLVDAPVINPTNAADVNALQFKALTTAEFLAFHTAAIGSIVGEIRAKYEDEGSRNLNIGGHAYRIHCAQHAYIGDRYEGADFDSQNNRIATDVQTYVAISPKSIRLGEWIRCHVARECLAELAGRAVADAITFHEYSISQHESLRFVKAELFGELRPGFLDFYKGISADRAQGKRVTPGRFTTLFDATVAAQASALKASTDPITAAAQAVTLAEKAKLKAVHKSNENISTAISDALAGKLVSAAGIQTIFETIAKAHKVALPASVGFNPAKCTRQEANVMLETVAKSGNLGVLRYIATRSAKLVAYMDAQLEAGTVTVEQNSTTADPTAFDIVGENATATAATSKDKGKSESKGKGKARHVA